MIQGVNPFIIIIDKDGDVVETMSAESVIDHVLAVCRQLDKTDPDYAPHLALEWKDGYFERVTDYHPTSIASRVASSVKLGREVKLKEFGFEDLTEDQRANIQLGRNLNDY